MAMPRTRPIRAVTAVDRRVLENLGHQRGLLGSMGPSLIDTAPIAPPSSVTDGSRRLPRSSTMLLAPSPQQSPARGGHPFHDEPDGDRARPGRSAQAPCEVGHRGHLQLGADEVGRVRAVAPVDPAGPQPGPVCAVRVPAQSTIPRNDVGTMRLRPGAAAGRSRRRPACGRRRRARRRRGRRRRRPPAPTNRCSPVAAASPEVPVTTVPTGKVKDHQVRLNGSPVRAVRTVTARARAAHSIAKPHTGRP